MIWLRLFKVWTKRRPMTRCSPRNTWGQLTALAVTKVSLTWLETEEITSLGTSYHLGSRLKGLRRYLYNYVFLSVFLVWRWILKVLASYEWLASFFHHSVALATSGSNAAVTHTKLKPELSGFDTVEKFGSRPRTFREKRWAQWRVVCIATA